MIESEALTVTRQVTAALDALGIPYVIGGSLAGTVHGVARATMDADIIADLRPSHAAGLIDALGDAFYHAGESSRGRHECVKARKPHPPPTPSPPPAAPPAPPSPPTRPASCQPGGRFTRASFPPMSGSAASAS